MFAFALFVLLVQATPDDGAAHRRAAVRPAGAPDSARILRSARSAQRAFESFRRNRLPVIRSYGGYACDVRIGRYCYWRGDETDDMKPPDEAREIGERRKALISELEGASTALPGDVWIAGQRVRYLVEANRTDDAWRYATEECAAGQTWCLSLAGYAAHRAQRFADADSAYTAALASMEPAERCRWLDVSFIVDDETNARLEETPCEDRPKLVRRLLLLAAPLYSVATTDLFTEHLARLTRARMAGGSAMTDGEWFADDFRELVIRYGWPQWYSRSLPDFGSMQDPRITGHDSGMPYSFLPPRRAQDHLSALSADDWRLADPQARTGYAPAYLKKIHGVSSQIARFWRGDSSLVVAAWDGRNDTTLIGRKLDVALVLASDLNADTAELSTATPTLTIARQTAAGATGHISVTGLLDSGLVSLELVSKENGAAGRARIGVGPRSTGPLTISDLLLYASSETEPRDLEAIEDSALANNSLPISRKIGVFWETYGLRADGEEAQFTLTVEEAAGGFLRRVAERLRFADPATSLRLQWTEMALPRKGISGRGVRVDLSRLHRGRYRIQLAVTARGETVVSNRDVVVQ